MGANGSDLTLLHQHDAISMQHCGQSVGNDERRTTRLHLRQRLLNQPLALNIQRTRRLIQQQNRRIPNNRPS